MEENNVSVQPPVVEQPKKKSNTGLIVFLVILVLGLAGYICYDKFIATNNVPSNDLKCKKDTCDCSNTVNNDTVINNNDTDAEYTYEDVAGYYTFTKLIEGRDEDYNAELYLFEDGTVRFQQGPDASNGYVGNYVIDGDTIKITKWFTTGSFSDLSLVEANSLKETIKIKSNDSVVLSKCYSFSDCTFEKDVDNSKDIYKLISSDGKLNSINEFLGKDHIITINNWIKDGN